MNSEVELNKLADRYPFDINEIEQLVRCHSALLDTKNADTLSCNTDLIDVHVAPALSSPALTSKKYSTFTVMSVAAAAVFIHSTILSHSVPSATASSTASLFLLPRLATNSAMARRRFSASFSFANVALAASISS